MPLLFNTSHHLRYARCFSCLNYSAAYTLAPASPNHAFFRLSQRKRNPRLAISQEEEDARIYADLAENLKTAYPATAEIFRSIVSEEEGPRHRLIDAIVPVSANTFRSFAGRMSAASCVAVPFGS